MNHVAIPAREWMFAGILTTVFAAALAVGLCRHELWRDEAKAWLIARDSTSLSDLLHNRRYEGHPILWYVPLYAVSRWTHNPLAMQIVHGVFAMAAVAVVAVLAPFSRVHRVLFAAGVFPLYEYAVVSRCYAQGALLLLLLAGLFLASRRRPILVALLVSLLANSSLYGLFIAIAFVLAWIVRWVPERKARLWRDAVAAMIVVTGLATAILQVIPPPPAVAAAPAGPLAIFSDERFEGTRIDRAIDAIWKSYVPIPHLLNRDQFYSNILDAGHPLRQWAMFVLSLGLLGTSIWLLWRSPVALTFFCVATSLILGFTWWKFAGSLRHQGHLFLVLFAALWMAWPTLGGSRRRVGVMGLSALLAIHASVGAYDFFRDVREPYSPSRECARLLNDRYGREFDLVSDPGNYASPIAAYLDIQIYFPVRRAFGSFELLDGTPKRATPAQLADALDGLLATSDRPVVLLTAYPLTTAGSKTRLLPIASMRSSLSGERYEVYQVERFDR